MSDFSTEPAKLTEDQHVEMHKRSFMLNWMLCRLIIKIGGPLPKRVMDEILGTAIPLSEAAGIDIMKLQDLRELKKEP